MPTPVVLVILIIVISWEREAFKHGFLIVCDLKRVFTLGIECKLKEHPEHITSVQAVR
jgi:hypothetical protein